MFNPEKNSGFTGGIFERQILGDGRKLIDLEKASASLQEKVKNGEYLTFEEAIAFVKDNYKDDPTDPEKVIANDLHAMVAQDLCPEDYAQLQFYCATGTPLDYLHGVDAFFEFSDKEGNIHRVTLDATVNEKKTEEDIKADVLLKDMPSKRLEKEKYKNHLREISDKILAVFEDRIEELKKQKRRAA